jgi:hypothetical protein
MADPHSALHPLLLQPHNNAILEDLERRQRDGQASAIARRIQKSLSPTEKRCTKTTVRALAWPISVGELQATTVVTQYFLQSRPRQHSAERHFFPSVKDALAKFPGAQVLHDPESVAPRLRPARA